MRTESRGRITMYLKVLLVDCIPSEPDRLTLHPSSEDPTFDSEANFSFSYVPCVESIHINIDFIR